MAKVLLVSTVLPGDDDHAWARADFDRLMRAGSCDRFGVHSLTNNVDDADVIIFVSSYEPDLLDVRQHPYVQTYRDQCFLFDTRDRVIPLLPGVYASIEERWQDRIRTRAGFYPRVFENDAIPCSDEFKSEPYLFSFVGSSGTSKVRKAVLALSHPRSLVLDTARESDHPGDKGFVSPEYRMKRYVDALLNSRFVLCPRGMGTSSMRLFEVMKAGRVPVIISDQWVPPDGPRWDRLSLRVAEKDVERIPELLEGREEEANEMGRVALAEWNNWFSKEAAFHRIVEWCLDIGRQRSSPESIARMPAYLQLLRPHFFRHCVVWRARRSLSQFMLGKGSSSA